MIELIRSKLRRELLAFYFSNVDRAYYVRELSRHLNVDATNLSRELHRLVHDGIFLMEENGNQKFFKLNRKHPSYADVRRIVSKTVGAGPQIGATLRLVRGIKAAILFGSFARGLDDTKSDIDVIVIGDAPLTRIISRIAPLERRLRRDINVTVYTPHEFALKKNRDPFLRSVFARPHQILFGSLWI